MEFWATIRDNQPELSAKMWDIFDEHSFGDEPLFLKSFDDVYHTDTNQIDIAKAYYILNRLSFGGKNPNKSNYLNPLKSGAGIKPMELKRFPRFAELVQGTKQTCLDYRQIEPLNANTLIYLDSPYCQNGGVTPDSDSYGDDYTIVEQEYIEYCESLRDKCHILISYGDTPNAIKCFDGWNVYRIPVIRVGKQVNKTELLITNYEIPYADMLCDEWELAA
jgi:site-specific DNA-adenine methylase